jgi:hypothetical protein
MKIELTDDEWTTVLVALDNYRAHKTAMAAELYDRQLTEDAGSAEWCWQKIWGEIARDRNATAVEAVKASLRGEFPERNEQPELPFNTQTNSGDSASVDPFDLGLSSQYDVMGDK